MSARIPRVSSLKTPDRLRAHLRELDCPLPCDDAPLAAEDSPLARPLDLGGGLRAPNRFGIQPMEGWDGTPEGAPSPLTRRRWARFGASGAGWIWGGEAVAVRRDGRANPHQLCVGDATAPALGALRRALLTAAERAGHAPPVVGLQLTHSGRWSRPEGAPAPRVAFRHPLLDRRAGVQGDEAVLSDGELRALARDFARAAALAQAEGFAFVDLKHCHGYLLHELLAARRRGGAYGGAALGARTRFLFETLAGMREAAPGLPVGVRLSVFDAVPYRPGPGAGGAPGKGEPEPHPLPYDLGFGVDARAPVHGDLSEPIALVRDLLGAGVRWINVTAGSPYTVPHLQRPALFPPSDGYAPPEDPLVRVAALLRAARDVKRAVPEAVVLSTGWSYLQEFLPHVAQACLREGWFDAVGLGRMALSYPELPAHVLAGKALLRGRICRTFSDCTTAPRNALVSGCYPLDPHYRDRPEREELERVKRERARGAAR